MDLHRSSGRPDWAAVAPEKRNSWQRLAARTHGVVTPGNVFTVAGLALVLIGLVFMQEQQYWLGLVMVGVGRLCDIWDGMAAAATYTKSPLGEALDASFDKLASVAAFILLITAHIISLPVAIILLLPNLSNAGLTALASRHAIRLHPSRQGKLFMAAMWLALSCFILAAATHHSRHSWIGLLGYLFVAVSFVLGLAASVTYYRYYRATLKTADL